MRLELRSIGAAWRQTTRQWTKMMAANLVTVLLSVPILVAAALVASIAHIPSSVLAIAGLMIGVLPNPMAAGMQYLARQLALGEGVFFSDMWEGLRRFGSLALRAWLLSLLATAVILANVVFYARHSFPLATFLQIIWLYVFLMWLCMHLYIFPLMMLQDDKRLWLTYRNAFVMSTRRPLATVLVGAVWVLVVVIGLGTGLAVLITFALAASIQQNLAAVSLPAFLPQKG